MFELTGRSDGDGEGSGGTKSVLPLSSAPPPTAFAGRSRFEYQLQSLVALNRMDCVKKKAAVVSAIRSGW
jgi:hypothetical protein